MGRKTDLCNISNLYIWKLGTSMNILIYHKYVLHSCKYSENEIFVFKIIENQKGSLALKLAIFTRDYYIVLL